jgi:superfamily II DNA helicase RecQ
MQNAQAISTVILTPADVLSSVFGYDAFRGQQEDIINDVIAGKSCGVLMPTGSGKSLCYQIPSICMEGTGIIVSPLIALMQDQVAALREAGSVAELWRVKLQEPIAVESGVLLAGIDWHESSLVKSTARFNDGRWQVTLRRPLQPLPGGLSFAPGRELTLGIALHGADNPGGKHWISLPMTFATDGINTDFKTD